MDKENRLKVLKRLFEVGSKISLIELGVTATTTRGLQLEKIFEKILLHTNSICVLMEKSYKTNQNTLDISSIASAARNTMESTNLYFYFAERKLSKDEIEFRYILSCLNSSHNKNTILSKLSIDLNNDTGRLHAFSEEINQKQLKATETFDRLSKLEQEHLLSGSKQTFSLKSPDILPKNIESAIYNLLSNSVHNLKLGMTSNSFNWSPISHGLFKPAYLIEISIEIVVLYLSHVMLDYLNLRKRMYKNLSKEDLSFLKFQKHTTYVDIWIKSMQDFMEKSN